MVGRSIWARISVGVRLGGGGGGGGRGRRGGGGGGKEEEEEGEGEGRRKKRREGGRRKKRRGRGKEMRDDSYANLQYVNDIALQSRASDDTYLKLKYTLK